MKENTKEQKVLLTQKPKPLGTFFQSFAISPISFKFNHCMF